MHSVLANLHTPSSLPASSRTKLAAASAPLKPNGGFAPRKLPPISIAVRAEGGGKDSLDHLQRAAKASPPPQPQPPRRRPPQSTPLGLWDRFPTARTVDQMMETMERIMEDPLAFSYPSYPLPSNGSNAGNGNYRRGRTPWEIKEGEEEYRMRFDMPGMTRKDVRVWVEERLLVVRAEKEGKEGEDEEWDAASYGKYSSRIALPENVELGSIKAEVRDGVLYITIPKVKRSSKAVAIDVQ